MNTAEDTSVVSRLNSRATNNDGTSNSNLSSAAIIIIVLVCAGFAVLVGYSTTRFFYNQEDGEDQITMQDVQERYMREVRQHNLQRIRSELGMKRSVRSCREESSMQASEGGSHSSFAPEGPTSLP